jgi:hypothetical protein
MAKKIVGIGFCLMSALLFSTRYICAAIYSISSANTPSSFGSIEFNKWLDYIGITPLILSILALVLGIGYLVWSEKDE